MTNTSSKSLRAARRALDDALAANPDSELLKERCARLERTAKNMPSFRERLAEIEAAMCEPLSDPRRMKELMSARDRLIAEIRELEGGR